MKAWMVAAVLLAAVVPAVEAQQGMEHKVCLYAAAEKLPNVAGMAVMGFRFVPPPGDPKAKAPGSPALAVEIDTTLAGMPATYLFICAGQVAGSQVVFPRGIVR